MIWPEIHAWEATAGLADQTDSQGQMCGCWLTQSLPAAFEVSQNLRTRSRTG